MRSSKIFCDIAEAWDSMNVADCASIWFLVRSVASAAKSASSMLDREASAFCVWLVKFDMVKPNDFAWQISSVVQCNDSRSGLINIIYFTIINPQTAIRYAANAQL